MWYLLGEIAVLLALAIVLGIAVGWVLWSWRRVSLPKQEFDRLMADRTELYRLKMGNKLKSSLDFSPVEPEPEPEPEPELDFVPESELAPERVAPEPVAESAPPVPAPSVPPPENRTVSSFAPPVAPQAPTAAASAAAATAAAAIPVPGLDNTIDLTRTRSASDPDAPDDLLAIDGIDGEMNRFLAEQGIVGYRQVGSLTDADIDRLESLMPETSRRIRDDQWVEQARHLYNDKFRNSTT